ncbi:MAG: DMT family transporter [Sulfuricaulis sp.]|uniref:EamA family transporter n=1 Tax=Sulfuricaulis sp. TaxID=2003553 RepID=UPI0034A1E7A8
MRSYPRWLGIAILLVIATVFALNHVAARVAFDHGTSVVTGVVFRSGGTALALLALLFILRTPIRLPPLTTRRALVIGALIALQSYCLYAAVARLPVALALLTFNIYPMVYTFISWAAGVERPLPSALVAMVVALFGLALALDIAHTGEALTDRWAEIGVGVAFATGASLVFGSVLFLNARWLHGVDGRVRSLLTMASCSVIALAGATATGAFALPHDGTGWLGLSLLTLFYGSAITVFFVVLPHMRATSDVAVLNFEPVALVFLGWAILGQTLAPTQIAGAFVVVGAIIALGMAKH